MNHDDAMKAAKETRSRYLAQTAPPEETLEWQEIFPVACRAYHATRLKGLRSPEVVKAAATSLANQHGTYYEAKPEMWGARAKILIKAILQKLSEEDSHV